MGNVGPSVCSRLERGDEVRRAAGLNGLWQEWTLVDPLASHDGFILAAIENVDHAFRAGAIVGFILTLASLAHLKLRDLHDPPDAHGDIRMLEKELVDTRIDLELQRRKLAKHARVIH